MRTLPTLLALSCTLAACAKDKDSDSGPSLDGVPAVDLVGDWNGELTGRLSTGGDDPACTGNVFATVDDAGTVSGTGTCQGVAVEEGAVFIVSFTGTASDGAVGVDLVFDGDAWADTTLSGSAETNAITLSGASTYTPDNREPVDATLELLLER